VQLSAFLRLIFFVRHFVIYKKLLSVIFVMTFVFPMHGMEPPALGAPPPYTMYAWQADDDTLCAFENGPTPIIENQLGVIDAQGYCYDERRYKIKGTIRTYYTTFYPGFEEGYGSVAERYFKVALWQPLHDIVGMNDSAADCLIWQLCHKRFYVYTKQYKNIIVSVLSQFDYRELGKQLYVNILLQQRTYRHKKLCVLL
jgi:hypothetical protein